MNLTMEATMEVNLQIHRISKKYFFESYGIRIIYLPPYLPFHNPIEIAVSKQKNYVREYRFDDEKDLCEKPRD